MEKQKHKGHHPNRNRDLVDPRSSRGRHVIASALLVSLLGAILFFVPDVAYAQADPGTATILNDVNEIVNLILRFFSAWLWPVLLMIGSLLDNDLIFGGAMGERLLAVWVQIRNLVNIIFVIILLAIAVYNVLGLGKEGGPLPLGLSGGLVVKFVLALLAVNFSFLAAKVVLDFTNVMTGAVFALPSTAVIEENGKRVNFQEEIEQMICGTPSKEVPFRAMWCEKDTQKFNSKAQNFFGRLDRSNIAVVYAIKFGRAVNLKFIRDDVKDITQLGFNIIFNMVMFFVYALSFIALFFVLLLRLVGLWVGVVLSPFIGLAIVLPNLKELAGEGGSIQEKFVQNAVAPIIIGLVLSVGYIMLDALQVQGHVLSTASLTSVDPHAVPTDIGDLQQLMIAVAMVAIVWMGVFGAAEKTFAKGITGWIREKAVGAGKFIGSLPKYAQVIPTGGKFGGGKDEKISFAQALSTWDAAKRKFEQDHGGAMGSLGGQKAKPEDIQALKNAVNLPQWAREFKDRPYTLNTPEGFAEFKDAMKRFKVVKDDDEFKTKFNAESHLDYAKAAAGMVRIDEFRQAGITDASKLVREISASADLKVSTPEKLIEALRNENASRLAQYDAFKGMNENQIKDYKKQFERVQGMPEVARMLITPDKNGVVAYDENLDDKINAVLTLVSALKNKENTPAALQDIVIKARNAGIVPRPVLEAIVEHTEPYPGTDHKNKAKDGLNPTKDPRQPPIQ